MEHQFSDARRCASQAGPLPPFAKCVEAWGRSYTKLGIDYRGATMRLDLLDRPKKYSNGFCHWPQPAWKKPDGWQPATANFTSLADPKQVGSGLVALTTLMHEAGHAAHFANILQPSPLFSQERVPTSVAYAENQSMFLDSLVGDAAWKGLYARNLAGEPVPWELIEEKIRATHPFRVFALRSMLAIVYFEKALYELSEEDLTAETIQKLADATETLMMGGPQGRTVLCVPHMYSDESSCYYHGYVLAQMSVFQTREHFLHTYGRIVDNAAVGKDLARVYWAPGNSRCFLDLVKELTGKPLSGDSWVAALDRPLADRLASERGEYDWAVAQPKPAGVVDLNMKLQFVDGDEVIASSEDSDFKTAVERFEAYLQKRFQ
eukprot:NODE_1062_length_1682_cov_12.195498_g997_i0.p1 GENE.NODE_1062_length_1682_cov_12.195498_g997_i0~~NODE_1062_length_1682_cov_12.195498_g997_i0.p1  ORF type:complete len:377 (+),score=101.37 NODE_1062_length_1682_cov_12.195498_g997_i0:547-1677(+)